METAAAPEERDRLMAAVRSTAAAPGAAERAHEVYALLDALADVDLADPRVDAAARALADCLPPELTTEISATTAPADQTFLKAFLADFAPAQAEAVSRAMLLVSKKAKESKESEKPEKPEKAEKAEKGGAAE